ncbi:ABC transporter ATP-binding protein [Candidatus Chlorohelix sp.]|uniref:ABC transporter ATP-binding protein n=1 Tax=Candidatus Chlorohelix sp. TaxID=3139201 RepID=UPI003021EDD0
MSEKLLELVNLKTSFYTRHGKIPAVDGVSLHINRGETVGIVGESGCGKSVTSLSILRLIPNPPGKIEAGQILLEGENLLLKSKKDMRAIRGNRISMIFQEPMSSLNPVLTIGRQIIETVILHQRVGRNEAKAKAIEMLKLVGIPSPEKRLSSYPFQLSGGQRQRVMIAIALVCRPQLLIADEPTTALDVTIQAQILDLMKELKDRLGMSILLITHDLGVVADIAERIIVMYAGQVVEEGSVHSIFKTPLHPYTKGLLLSIPKIGLKKERLYIIPGTIPKPSEYPTGCRFSPRCEYKQQICLDKAPPVKQQELGRSYRCWIGSEEYAEYIKCQSI